MDRKHATDTGRGATRVAAGMMGDRPGLDPTAGAPGIARARFGIGEVVRHRLFPFRGVVFDVDPEFANTEEWWEAIPEDARPAKDQPFYHLLAENEESSYIAYVSQQNLEADDEGEEVRHPAIPQIFEAYREGRYILRPGSRN